jgi:hypothetical protein
MVVCARAAETTSTANIEPSRRGFNSDIFLSKQIRCRLFAGTEMNLATVHYLNGPYHGARAHMPD